MKITINPNPKVAISLADACLSTAHLHATVTGGVAPYTFTWKKDGAAIANNSADLTLTGPGTYTVSVVDSSSTTCGSNTDSFVVCYTQGATASAPGFTPNGVNAAVKSKSEASGFLARLALAFYSTLAVVTF
jgi:hypothetical protein